MPFYRSAHRNSKTVVTKAHRTRFAPSPTGYLHLGHVRAAHEAFTFENCLLRIEDIDTYRCKLKFTEAIYRDLHWLGFLWPEPVRIQSRHRTDYQRVLDQLIAEGFVYACFRTRREIAGAGRPAPLPADEVRTRLTRGEPCAWRLHIQRCQMALAPLSYTDTGSLYPGTHDIDWAKLQDAIIARRDIGVSYHLATCHDDAVQNITHIVRGCDLWESTPYQRILQALMGWPEPLYVHHDIVRDIHGRKLSKRKGAYSLMDWRTLGKTPDMILHMALTGETV